MPFVWAAWANCLACLSWAKTNSSLPTTASAPFLASLLPKVPPTNEQIVPIAAPAIAPIAVPAPGIIEPIAAPILVPKAAPATQPPTEATVLTADLPTCFIPALAPNCLKVGTTFVIVSVAPSKTNIAGPPWDLNVFQQALPTLLPAAAVLIAADALLIPKKFLTLPHQPVAVVAASLAAAAFALHNNWFAVV